jgi:L-alanine-DL-glutamate epimerase-like enolase superfamily enzyme
VRAAAEHTRCRDVYPRPDPEFRAENARDSVQEHVPPRCAERAETASIWVEAVGVGGVSGYGESCPRPYVTGETLDTARAFFDRHEAALRAEVSDLASLGAWMAAQADELDANPAAWCAIELSILDVLAKERRQTVEAFLSLPPLQGRFRYSAVLGDAAFPAFQATAERYRRQGFADFKVKLSGSLERDLEKMSVFRRWDSDPVRVRVDANNLWNSADEAIHFLQALDYPVFAVEEPVQPNRYAELAAIAQAVRCKIVLDESFLRVGQFAQLAERSPHWIVNLRVSKMGGLLRSLAVVAAGRALRLGIIVGAQVGETSLLTRSALTVAAAAEDVLVAQEGAFGTFLLERDVCDPPLMFGAGGILDVSTYPALIEPGLIGATWMTPSPRFGKPVSAGRDDP